VKTYDPAGGDDRPVELALGMAGNVYIAGGSWDPVTGYDCVTLKYDSSGSLRWDRRYDGPASGTDSAVAVAVDACEHVYVAGVSTDPVTGADFTVLKYDSEGNLIWERRYAGQGDAEDSPVAMKLDQHGNVYVTGTSETAGSPKEILTLKYNADGYLLWDSRYDEGYGAGATATGLDVDASFNVYVTGDGYFEAGNWADFVTIKYSALPCVCSAHGDVAGDDGFLDILDVVGLIDYIFLGIGPLASDPQCPHINRGDVNCDGINNVQDIVYLIDFVFRGDFAPCDPCACSPYPTICP
jgi:hypothetical protein